MFSVQLWHNFSWTFFLFPKRETTVRIISKYNKCQKHNTKITVDTIYRKIIKKMKFYLYGWSFEKCNIQKPFIILTQEAASRNWDPGLHQDWPLERVHNLEPPIVCSTLIYWIPITTIAYALNIKYWINSELFWLPFDKHPDKSLDQECMDVVQILYWNFKQGSLKSSSWQ